MIHRYISNFLSKITDIGLRISFKESGVKFARWIQTFSPLVGKVLKFQPVMLGQQGVAEEITQENQ